MKNQKIVKISFKTTQRVIRTLVLSLTLISCTDTIYLGKHKMIFTNKEMVYDEIGTLYEYRIENEKRFIEFKSNNNYYVGDSIFIKKWYERKLK